MFNIKVLLFLILSPVNVFAQSPWVNKKGSIYSQISSTYLSYKNIVNDKGDFIKAKYKTLDLTTAIFTEYSITDKTSIVTHLPYKFVQSNGQQLSGSGDVRIEIKHQLFQKTPFALHYGYTAPLSDREEFLRTGYNQHAIDAGISIGLAKKKFYTYSSISYNFRNNIPDQLILDSEIGYVSSITKRTLYFMFHLNGFLNLSSIEDPESADALLYHNNAQYLSPGIKSSYNIRSNFWINIAINSALIARNTGGASSISGGVAYSLKR